MEKHKPLLLRATLGSIEVEGNNIEDGKWRMRSQYSVRVYVADKKVAKATSQAASSELKWEWSEDNEIWFESSSTIKVVIYRGFETDIKPFNHLVGQHEGKIVDLLENDAKWSLTDKKGIPVSMKMKIALSPISDSDDYIKEFMDRVDADIVRLPSNDDASSIISTLGQVLKLTKTIMDQFSHVHPILGASWSVVSSIYQVAQETGLQDESIRELVNSLRELSGVADAVPNLPVIANTTNVIEEISRQSIQVASLIHEYAKLPFTGRSVKIQIFGDLKTRIAGCQQRCADLKEDFLMRLHLDTNDKVDEMKRTLDLIKDDTLAQKIHTWLSPPDSSKNRNEADEKRQIGTCFLFLNGERFKEWQEKPVFLWIKGKAGSGKSILCSSIITKLLEKDTPVGIAYFFFDGRDSQNELQLHDKLIRSLISQFSYQRGGTPSQLADLYKHCGYHQQPSVNQLQDTLRGILDGFSHAYIIIDALDECTNRQMTLDWVSKLVAGTGWKAPNLHIVVTSRPERDIEKVFDRLDPHSIDVGEPTANGDILKYLEFQMAQNFTEYDENTRKEIESRLKEHADGSFRWVALQLTVLAKCLSKHEIKQQLKNLPKDLDEVYGRMLKSVDVTYHADTMTFLQWLAFSRRPMRIAEIAEVITIDFDSKDGPVFNSGKRYNNPRDVLVRCSSLVSESGGTIKLSHFSVKEYLLSNRVAKNFSINEKTCHSKIAEISVAYLLQFQSFEPLTHDMLDSSPLAHYAAEHWINHAESGGMDPAVWKLISRLFMSETASLTNWIRIWNIEPDIILNDQPIWFDRRPNLSRTPVSSPLYYALVAGLELVAYDLLEKGAEVNIQGGKYGNALYVASLKGHEGVAKILLEKGAEVNAQGGLYGNALQAASQGGHETIVKVLLEKGAEVNAQGGEYGSALQAASQGGHETIVKVLLEKGADVDAQGGLYVNALQAASQGGHETIVKVLLEKGADVNALGGLYGNALQAASLRGHETIVKVLLEKGADVDAQGGLYGSALQAASQIGHEEVVKILLKKGAKVNAQGGQYGNALQAASLRGHETIVKVLLEKGAEVNAQGGQYGNALLAASLRGHEEVVKILLEKGAEVNVNAQGEIFIHALQAASYIGRETIVKVLLEKGAEVNAQGGQYGNALQAASYSGHEAVVKILLKKGAEVNAQGGRYGNALQAASQGGHETIVKVLLEKGADVNAQGGLYGSALQAALSARYRTVVKVLLQHSPRVKTISKSVSLRSLRARTTLFQPISAYLHSTHSELYSHTSSS